MNDSTQTTDAPSKATEENPHFGHGGSYAFDPTTGQTTLIERSGHITVPPPATQPQTQE